MADSSNKKKASPSSAAGKSSTLSGARTRTSKYGEGTTKSETGTGRVSDGAVASSSPPIDQAKVKVVIQKIQEAFCELNITGQEFGYVLKEATNQPKRIFEFIHNFVEFFCKKKKRKYIWDELKKHEAFKASTDAFMPDVYFYDTDHKLKVGRGQSGDIETEFPDWINDFHVKFIEHDGIEGFISIKNYLQNACNHSGNIKNHVLYYLVVQFGHLKERLEELLNVDDLKNIQIYKGKCLDDNLYQLPDVSHLQVYIGQTKDFEGHWKGHCQAASRIRRGVGSKEDRGSTCRCMLALAHAEKMAAKNDRKAPNYRMALFKIRSYETEHTQWEKQYEKTEKKLAREKAKLKIAEEKVTLKEEELEKAEGQVELIEDELEEAEGQVAQIKKELKKAERKVTQIENDTDALEAMLINPLDKAESGLIRMHHATDPRVGLNLI